MIFNLCRSTITTPNLARWHANFRQRIALAALTPNRSAPAGTIARLR